MKLLASDEAVFKKYLARNDMEIKSYQCEGVAWALQQERNGHILLGKPPVRGGLLADEMGLGKTIQMIGAILCNPQRNTLVVVPRALLEQWESVLWETTGHQAVVFHDKVRHEYTLEELQASPVVITTYATLATGCESTKKKKKTARMDTMLKKSAPKKNLLLEMKWGRVIFDEAHHLRNSNTRIFVGAKKVSSPIRWLITGTPIQNRKADFYALCEQIGLPEDFYTVPDYLSEVVRLFIMKRTKKDVGIALPEMTMTEITVPWSSPEEQALAENIHELLHFSKINNNYVDNIISYLDMPKLALMLRARQVCVYPRLMHSAFQDWKVVLFNDDNVGREDDSIEQGMSGESKLAKVCEKIVERKDNGNAKLVFCHYRGEIDAIREKLEKNEIRVEVFDGRVNTSDRKSILESSCDVLILQINTGCEGLNLQQFNEIYFVSPHWNPAVEDQAIARCYRIGQQKKTEVFRFVMGGFDADEETTTLDQYSTEVQNVKREVMTMLENKEERSVI